MTASRYIVPASTKGEQGWLSARLIVGTWVYAVTMDETQATNFRNADIAARHIERARRAGLIVPTVANRG